MNLENNEKNSDDKFVAIVDGFSIGSFYPAEFAKHGYKCVNIQSAIEIPAVFKSSFIVENYYDHLIYTGDNLAAIVAKLNTYKIKHVIAGAEYGVEFADLLANEMHLSTANCLELSGARRDKFKMIEALKSNGLYAAEHIKTDNLEALLSWAKKLNRWPIILKQLKCAGGERMTVCYGSEDIANGFKKIIGTIDFYYNENKEVLAESYLQGDQYIVNLVSCGGLHKLSDLWICKKASTDESSIIFDYVKLLPYEYPLKDELVSYTCKALDALGIEYGASHNEVMLTAQGPALIESGARLMGLIKPALIFESLGQSQLGLAVESYLQPHEFVKKVGVGYKIKKHLLCKLFISYTGGSVKKIKFTEEIKKLKSFQRMDLGIKEGSLLSKTIDLATSPGTVYLSHEDESVVDGDYKKLLAFEKEMFEIL